MASQGTTAALRYNPQPPRPAWGVRAPLRKYDPTREPVLVAPAPSFVRISLAQAAGPPAVAIVQPGTRVLRGQPIADAAEAGGARVHASIAGTVTAVAAAPVAGSEGAVPCVDITGDGTDERYGGYPGGIAPGSRHGGALLELIAEGGIVGLGGALFPTARKLAAPGVQLLLLNGAECEPYLSCDDLLLRERAGRVVAGAQLMLDALGAPRAVIAVKTDMSAARVAVHDAIAAAGDERLAISVVTARYPAGGERQLIELVTGLEVPSGGLPPDVGIVCQNVATAAAVADFCLDGEPLIRRIVTVSGGGVMAPRNIEARIGTPIRDLVALAGGYQREPQRLIMGGPMMGVALPSDGLAITRATNGLIVATASELGSLAPELPCIRCGDCVEVCPARLMPQELFGAVRHGDVAALATLGVMDCIECRACDYVCPSWLPLARSFIEGKALLETEHGREAGAAAARERHEAREERLARTAREQAAALDALRGRAGPDDDGGGDR